MTDFTKYRALSFDCYGTLIDWESGIAAAAQPWIARQSGKIDADAFLTSFGRLERQVQGETPGKLYPLILEEVLQRIAAEHGLDASDEEAKAFGASVPDWPAFPDSHDALTTLAGKYKLIILSNVDRASFAGSNKRLDVAFDKIITAQDVGSYKPDLKNFEVLLASLADLGIEKHELLHVAESMNHDVVPANRVGLDVVWIDRGRNSSRPRASGSLPEGARTFAEFESMAEFAATV
jgi:putative hydrolase of the HAD superfamily